MLGLASLDLIILLILLYFVINGLVRGFYKIISHFLALILSAIITSRYYLLIYSWFAKFFSGNEALAKIIVFILSFIIISRLIGYAFKLLAKLFKLVSIIPLTKLIDRILGGLLGFLEASLFISLILFILLEYLSPEAKLSMQIAESVLAPVLLNLLKIIQPILPQALEKIRNLT